MGDSEKDGHSDVSDGADFNENYPQGEYSNGNSGSVQTGSEGSEQGQTQSFSSEVEEVTQSVVTSDSGEDSELDSLYGSIDKFYL